MLIEGEGKEAAPLESRFGNEAEMIRAMKEGEVRRVGRIEELFPDTPAHRNEVHIVDVNHRNANQVVAVEIQAAGQLIRCIFKPSQGEDLRSKREMGVEGMDFYPRECAAYVIDRHFGFGVVPPTVIREVEGQIGALQLFLDHSRYATIGESQDEQTDKRICGGDDWRTIAVLDWILANTERHPHNIMYSRSRPELLFAIDHGLSLNSYVYFNHTVRGPSLQLTMDPVSEKPKTEDLPAPLAEKVRSGLARREALSAQLSQFGLRDYEIKALWRRVEDLLRYGKYLSKYNYQAVTGHSPLSIDYSS